MVEYSYWILFYLLGGNDAVLSLVSTPSKVDVPVVERETPPEVLEIAKWKRYNLHPFSPYAHTEG